MRFTVEVNNIRELIAAAGVPMGALAQQLGRSETMASNKLKGKRSLFLDEVGAIVGAINDHGRMTVTDAQVIKLIGKHNLKVRGFAG